MAYQITPEISISKEQADLMLVNIEKVFAIELVDEIVIANATTETHEMNYAIKWKGLPPGYVIKVRRCKVLMDAPKGEDITLQSQIFREIEFTDYLENGLQPEINMLHAVKVISVATAVNLILDSFETAFDEGKVLEDNELQVKHVLILNTAAGATGTRYMSIISHIFFQLSKLSENETQTLIWDQIE